MSSTTKVSVPHWQVVKIVTGYRVMLHTSSGWTPASKTYNHSTSAFAALGRLIQKSITEAKT